MKRALKVIIPLLLSVAIICSMAWYFMVYDRDFTKDLLLWSARTLEQEGKHDIAAWLYHITYEQASFEDDIAIELSNQYKSIGNYTKAEYTLAEAIASNPTTDLYVALCNLYVQQDKLLDAVALMDTVGDSQIKAELEAMRPNAPVLSPEPGFYSQYITVEASADAATLFVNAQGEFPTTEKNLYTAPITLPQGETVLYALAVNDKGLVSPLTVSGYTIGGVIEKVTFTDPAIENVIRDAIGAKTDDAVFTNALWNIKEFTVPAEATSYADLAYLPYLETLRITDAVAGELTNIANLTALKALDISNGSLNEDELTVIGKLTELKRLTLSNCGLSTVSSLSALSKLEYLDLSKNTVRNLTALSNMQQLQELYLNNNAINDLSYLTNLTQLKVLDVAYNSLTSIDPVGAITSLTYLNFAQNQVSDVRKLSTLNSLKELNASYNSLSDINAIYSIAGLEILNISNNSVTDITGLNALEALVNLNLSYNQVEELPQFSKTAALVSIDGSYNKIKDLKGLSSLQNLNIVLMDYNEELSSLHPLDSCHRLVKVNAYGTKVSDVRFLTDKSVVVNYNPTNEQH